MQKEPFFYFYGTNFKFIRLTVNEKKITLL